jgi:hypothetical protein
MSFRNVPLSPEPAPPPSANRRANVRYHCAPATRGRLRLPPSEELQNAWVLDVSLAGVGLLLNRPLEPGLSVVIRVGATAGARVFDLAARVIHATKEIGGDWVVGCRLDTPLTRDDLDALV